MKRNLILALTLTLTFLAVGLNPRPAAAQASTQDARDALMSYYNAINARDFQTAYNMRVNPTQTYQSYVTGFNDTLRVEPYFGAVDIGVGISRIPAVLISYMTNGTITSYYGCFSMVNQTGAWQMQHFSLRQISVNGVRTGMPDNNTILGYLALNCPSTLNNVTPAYRDINASTEAHQLIFNYYDTLNRRDYASSYAMWLAPIPGDKPNGAPATDYRTPYQQYVTGYNNTRYINVYVGDYQYMGASAGHSYVDGALPVVLVGQNIDGSSVTYSGCYILGRFLNTNTLGIVNGRLAQLGSGVAQPSEIINALISTSCTGINF